MNSLKLVLATVFLISHGAFAEELIEEKLFILEKNFRAENSLVVNTQIDENCKFVSKNNEYIDFYWLVDKKTKKEIHPLIRKEIKKSIVFELINKERNFFKIRINDLSELKHDLEDTALEVSSAVTNGTCRINSVLKLGPSASYRLLNLKRIYCDVSTNLLGVPSGCKYLDLEGTNVDTGKALKVRFDSSKIKNPTE